MSLLKRNLVDETVDVMVKEQRGMRQATPPPPLEVELEEAGSLIDITVQDLSTIVNLPPEEDPFIQYLEQYISSMMFMLDRIAEIKTAEKQLSSRLSQALKLYKTLTKSHTSAESVPTEQPVESNTGLQLPKYSLPSAPAKAVLTIKESSVVKNLGDFE